MLKPRKLDNDDDDYPDINQPVPLTDPDLTPNATRATASRVYTEGMRQYDEGKAKFYKDQGAPNPFAPKRHKVSYPSLSKPK